MSPWVLVQREWFPARYTQIYPYPVHMGNTSVWYKPQLVYAQLYGFDFLRFTIIIVYSLRRMLFVCVRRFTQNSNYGVLEFAHKHTTFVLFYLHKFSIFPSLICLCSRIQYHMEFWCGWVSPTRHYNYWSSSKRKEVEEGSIILPQLYAASYGFLKVKWRESVEKIKGKVFGW